MRWVTTRIVISGPAAGQSGAGPEKPSPRAASSRSPSRGRSCGAGAGTHLVVSASSPPLMPPKQVPTPGSTALQTRRLQLCRLPSRRWRTTPAPPRRPVTSRRQRRRSPRAHESFPNTLGDIAGEWPRHGLEARARSWCQRPLLEDFWGTLGRLIMVSWHVPFESSLTFRLGAGPVASERVSWFGGGIRFFN